VFGLFIAARRHRSHVHIFVMHLMTAMVIALLHNTTVLTVTLEFFASHNYNTVVVIVILYKCGFTVSFKTLLIFKQIVMCFGAIGITYTTDESPWNYFFFTFFLGGVFATRLWSALLSLELVILLVFGPNFATLRWLLTLLTGWGLVHTIMRL